MNEAPPITLREIRVAFVRETDQKTGETWSVAVFLDVPWRRQGHALDPADDFAACYTFCEGHSSGSLAYFRTLPPVDNSILKDILQKVVYKDRTIIEVPITTKATWESP